MILHPVLSPRLHRLPSLFFALLLALIAILPGVARADTPPVLLAGVVTPDTPTYIDPIALTVTVTSSLAGPLNGTLTYTVDTSASQTAAVTNGTALVPLGAFAPGAHTVTYQYVGTGGTSSSQQTSFTTTDLPFSFIGSEQTVIYNHTGLSGIASDSQSNMFITAGAENKLYKLDLKRNLTVVPTSGLSGPQGITLDAADNIYIVDTNNNRVVQLTPAGVQTTVPFTGLSAPTSIAFNSDFSNLYVNDLGNGRIVQLTLATGTQTTVVTGIPRITGLAVDPSGNLYFGQRYSYQNGAMFKLDTAGNITSGYFGAPSPETLAMDRFGDLYFTDDYLGLIEIDSSVHLTHLDNFYGSPIGVDHNGQIYFLTAYSGVITPGPAAKLGPAGAFGLGGPNSQPSNNTIIYQVPYNTSLSSVDISSGGGSNLSQFSPACLASAQCSDGVQFGPTYPGFHTGYITATLNNKATLQTNVYGTGLASNEAFDPGLRSTATSPLTSAGGMAEAEDHTIYVTDPSANKVYSLGIGGTATPVVLPFTGLTQPTQIAVDGSKNVFVLDNGKRIVELTPGGTQTTVYDTNRQILNSITAMALDSSGALILGGNEAEAGPGLTSYIPAGTEFVIAKLPFLPSALAIDGAGGIYEIDSTSNTLRRYTYLGGNSTIGTPVTVAYGIPSPVALTVEPSGTVFVALGTAGSLLQIRPDGSTATPYSGLGAASAVVEDGRGVLTVIDGTSGKLYLDDRRTNAYNFPNQAVGTTSAALPGTITNDGNQTLGGIGGLPGDSTFTQVAETGACTATVPDAGTSLTPGTFCKLDYTFTPPSATTISESGTEQDSTYSPGSDFSYRTITFTGTGVNATAPTAALTPAAVTFTSVAIGSTSTQILTLTNAGTAALPINSFSTASTVFTVASTTCTSSLAAGSSCTYTLSFTPTTTGTQTATFSVTDSVGTQTSALTGAATAAPAPTATLTPAAVTFTSVAIGSTSTQILTLSNAGNAALPITSASTGSTVFTVASTTCTSSLAAGSSCTYTLSFTPTTTGTQTATFSVTDSVGTQTSALTGAATAAPAPTATLTPSTLSFQATTTTAAPQQIATLTNSGNATLNISSIALSGSNATSFTNTTTCGATLAAGSSCNITVGFNATVVGTYTATLTVADNASPATQTVTLGGQVTGVAQATLTPSATFGPVTVGSSAIQTLTLSNAGTAALTITSASTGSTIFTLSSTTCTASLAAGASCTYTLTYTPTAPGTQTATFSVADSVGTQTSALSGSATPVAAPQAVLTPATANFGSIPVNSTSPAQTFTLSNPGNASLPITSIALTNPQFAISSNSCTTTLAAGAACSLSITFTPTSTTSVAATLTVIDSVGTQTSALNGTGITPPDFTLSATPSAQSSYRGQSITYTISLASLSSTNPFTGSASLTAAGLPPGATFTFSPATVSATTTSTLTVAIPALVARNSTPSRIPVIAFASLLGAGLLFTRRRRLHPRLLLLLIALAGATFISGCGTGTGFDIPTATSVITVTGTSGSLSHSTTVTLTVK